MLELLKTKLWAAVDANNQRDMSFYLRAIDLREKLEKTVFG